MAEKLGRPPRFTRQELEDRLVEAGIAALVEAGIDVDLSAARLDTAISRAAVPRRAAYALLSDPDGERGPQETFRRQILIRILRDTPLSEGLTLTRNAAVAALADFESELASGDRDRIDHVMQQMIRIVGGVNFSNLQGSAMWQVYRTACAVTATQPNPDPEILEALREGEQALVAGYADFFADMATIFGLTLRPEFTLQEFAIAAYALNEGLAMRVPLDWRATNITVPGLQGSTEWTLLAVGFEALVDRFWSRADPAPG